MNHYILSVTEDGGSGWGDSPGDQSILLSGEDIPASNIVNSLPSVTNKIADDLCKWFISFNLVMPVM